MRFSEAIRLGAMMKPQGYNAFLSTDGQRTCALGAALDAIGALGNKAVQFNDYRDPWPITTMFVQHPAQEAGETQRWSLESVIVQLNDVWCWTREQIADWVEQIEVDQQTPVEEQMACRNT